DRLDRLRRDGAGVGDDDLTIRSGFAQPVGAVDNGMPQIGRHLALDLLDWPRRKPQINRAAGLIAQPIMLRRRAITLTLDVCERKSENDGQLIDVCWLERRDAVLRHPDQRLRE